MKGRSLQMETIPEEPDSLHASVSIDISSAPEAEAPSDAETEPMVAEEEEEEEGHDQSFDKSFAAFNNSSFIDSDDVNCSMASDYCGARLLIEDEDEGEGSATSTTPDMEPLEPVDGPKSGYNTTVATTIATRVDCGAIKAIINKNRTIKSHMQSMGLDFVSELNSVHQMYRSMLLDFHGKAAREIGVYKQELDTALVEKRRLHNKIQEMKGNIRVLCRVRPPTAPNNCAAECRKGGQLLTVNVPSKGIDRNGQQRPPEQKTFSFDCVLGPQSSQEEVYNEVRGMVDSAYDGYHCTVVAYGQTGAGKTFTMQGTDAMPGISKNTLRDVFQMKLKKESSGMQSVSIFVSMIEVYNETFRDLLCEGPSGKIEVRESSQGAVTIHGARQVPVATAEDVEVVAQRGQANRAVGSTKCNNQSSRSHMVLMIDLEVRERSVFEAAAETGAAASATNNAAAVAVLGRTVSSGRISLVDLAGSERISKSEASGSALTEAKHINKSLSALIDVISALSERERKSKIKQQQQQKEASAAGTTTNGTDAKGKKAAQPSADTASDVHIPFRNSKLTHLLMGSLKPGSKLVFIAQIAPENEHVAETCNTLEFGTRAKGVDLGKSKDAAVKQVSLENAERSIEQLSKEVDRLQRLNAALTSDKSSLEAASETSKRAAADHEAKCAAAVTEAKESAIRAAHAEAQMAEMEKRLASLVSLNQSLSEKNSKLKDAETKLTNLLKAREKEDARAAAASASAMSNTTATEHLSTRRSASVLPSTSTNPAPSVVAPTSMMASSVAVKEDRTDRKRKSAVEAEGKDRNNANNRTSEVATANTDVSEEASAEAAGSRRKKVCFEAEAPAAATAAAVSMDVSKRTALVENVPPADAIQAGKLSRAEELLRWRQMKSDTDTAPLSSGGLLSGGAARRTSVLQPNGTMGNAMMSMLSSGAGRSSAAATASSSSSSSHLLAAKSISSSSTTGTSLFGSLSTVTAAPDTSASTSTALSQKLASKSAPVSMGLGGLPGRVTSSAPPGVGMPRRSGSILPQR